VVGKLIPNGPFAIVTVVNAEDANAFAPIVVIDDDKNVMDSKEEHPLNA
jgi:hypothetical protein